MNKLSILMAVYNEEKSINEVLSRINKVETGLENEIIIVDGCSTDGTREILKKVNHSNVKIIFEQKRNGKGFALRQAFKEATGDIILIQDADLEIDPFDYPYLLKPILEKKVNVVFGSRFLSGRGKTNWINYLGNRLVTLVANLLFGASLTDMETCYKVFEKGVLSGMEFCCRGFDFDAELTAMILKRGFNIVDVPISYNPRNKKEGKKLHWSVGFTSLAAIIRIRFE